jgi:DNA-binding MarR family transcriptional regulator
LPASYPEEMSEDAIDRLVDQWRRERPGLDPRPMAVIGRLLRAARGVDRAIGARLAEHDLQPGWFDLLSALRRAGAPHRLTPGQLADALMLSTGGMTKRLDHMESADLLKRLPDPHDRRGLLIELTDKGRRVVDAAVVDHVENEEQLLRPLTRLERAELERLLDKLDIAPGTETSL